MLVHISTDGSVVKNPGPGGWAAVFRMGEHCKVLYGSEELTTNNQMELMAAIRALEHLRCRCEVKLTTDSQYLKGGITSWIYRWKKNGWKTLPFEVNGKPILPQPVKNKELWMRLDAARDKHVLSWEWVKGHDIHQDNIICDTVAKQAAIRQISGLKDLTNTQLVQTGDTPVLPVDPTIARFITLEDL